MHIENRIRKVEDKRTETQQAEEIKYKISNKLEVQALGLLVSIS